MQTASQKMKARRKANPEVWMAGRKRIKVRRWAKIKAWINDFKASHPCVCGESDPSCLDFHHRDPIGKDGDISKFVKRTITRVMKEAEKCEVICANCHRKGHAGHPRPEHAPFFPCEVIPICGEGIIRITPPSVAGATPHPTQTLAGQLTLSL